MCAGTTPQDNLALKGNSPMPVIRRKAGGYDWRTELENLLVIQKRLAQQLHKLQAIAANQETSTMIAAMLYDVTMTIAALHELHDYRNE